MKDYHINIFVSEEDEGYIADIPDLATQREPKASRSLNQVTDRQCIGLRPDFFSSCRRLRQDASTSASGTEPGAVATGSSHLT